ncbi:hypothetical protein [Bradyrhizobium canariense]|uniref:hypothetical protein n=1 Tax=Bradyrhizobium canariense TaxID=255045 RepID=UPI001FEC2C6F|nr:hypothetical protein [Bradyrhizobium canariense]
MKIVLVSMALLGGQMVIPVSDRIPELNVEATCKATAADDKSMGLADAQTYADCMRDEMTAQKQVVAVWNANPGPVRDSCEGEATAGGSPSYVDLLVCMQMADWVKSPSSAPL